jgi:hypothetical protein
MCWPLLDGSSTCIPIDEQPNHQIVHAFRLGKAQRATNQPLDPSPEIDVLALDFLRVLLAYVTLFIIDAVSLALFLDSRVVACEDGAY